MLTYLLNVNCFIDRPSVLKLTPLRPIMDGLRTVFRSGSLASDCITKGNGLKLILDSSPARSLLSLVKKILFFQPIRNKGERFPAFGAWCMFLFRVLVIGWLHYLPFWLGRWKLWFWFCNRIWMLFLRVFQSQRNTKTEDKALAGELMLIVRQEFPRCAG